MDKPETLNELFLLPRRWCQGASARDKHGESVSVTDPKAITWCLDGALDFVYGANSPEREAQAAKLRALLTTGDEAQDAELDLASWNDAEERTFKQVKALVIRAGV